MHLDFHFTAVQTLWTLTFAALLVLLVVLMGRDRIRGFKWFTASMVIMAFRMLASRLLFGRMAPIVTSEIFIVLADLAAFIALMVVVEMARRAFSGASRRAWLIATLVVLLVCGLELWKWGPWPSAKTFFDASQLGILRAMQLFAQKADLLADLLMVQVGLIIILVGRHFSAPWRSHTQKVVIGLSTGSLAQIAVRVIWQQIATHTTIHSSDEYQRVMGLQEKFYNASSVIYIAVLIWWIVWLWFDEPGTAAASSASQKLPATSDEFSSGANPSPTSSEL